MTTKLIDMMCQATILALCAVITVSFIWGMAFVLFTLLS